LAVQMGQAARGTELCAAAATIFDGLGVPFTPHEQEAHDRAVAAMPAALGEQGFTAAWTAGRALTVEQAVARASDAE
jgi:hypothetical protein